MTDAFPTHLGCNIRTVGTVAPPVERILIPASEDCLCRRVARPMIHTRPTLKDEEAKLFEDIFGDLGPDA